MPLREDLLVPISGENPSGQNLRYAPIYDKVKEARRKEDPIAQGDWQRPLKEADYRLVIKLASEILASTTKDLQLGAWLTEALVYQESFAGLTEGLNLLRNLLESFWDTVYPELEDGDMELRAAPLSWVGEYRELELAVRCIPLTKGGFNWLKYKESRAVGYEADVGESDSKNKARKDAIAEGKLTAEEFDAAMAATSLKDLEQSMTGAESALESLRLLDDLCQEKFGNDAPGFRILRTALEDVHHVLRIASATKRQNEPQPEPEPEPDPAIAEAPFEESVDMPAAASPAAAAAPARARTKVATAEPLDREDAIRRIVEAAAYLRREDPRSPVPYLVLRGLRWGELRASTDAPNPELLEPPPTEIRQQLKRLMMDGQWEQVLETAESAMGLPCGRGWLDLQRYVVRACSDLGYEYAPVASAIRSGLRALLKDIPQLPSMTLLDDTATANAETQTWLAELTPAESPESVAVVETPPEPVTRIDAVDSTTAGPVPQAVDPYDLALEATRSGKPEEGMHILAQQIAQERSGRGRFLRRMQLAQICILSNRHAIAFPILQDLAQEIDLRKLETWEQAESIAHTLALLLQTMQKLRFADEERHKIYMQICRLDPLQAARLSD